MRHVESVRQGGKRDAQQHKQKQTALQHSLQPTHGCSTPTDDVVAINMSAAILCGLYNVGPLQITIALRSARLTGC